MSLTIDRIPFNTKSEDASFMLIQGIRILGLVADAGGAWVAYPWHSLNGSCNPVDSAGKTTADLGVFDSAQEAVDVIVAEAREKGRLR